MLGDRLTTVLPQMYQKVGSLGSGGSKDDINSDDMNSRHLVNRVTSGVTTSALADD